MDFQLPKITLTKDQLQKIALSFLLLCFVIYGFFSFLLTPLQVNAGRAEAESVTLEKKIADANIRLRGLGELKTKAAAAGGLVAQALAFIPDGAPIAWYPPRMRSFFSRHGFTNLTIAPKASEALGDREFDKRFSISNWTIQISSADFFSLGIAISGLENEEVLSEITSISISTRENPEAVAANLDVQSVLKVQ